MKRKLIATLLVLGLMLAFVPMTIFSTSAENTWSTDGDQLYVTTADDLIAFATAIAGGNTFSGKTINIMADIDIGWRNIDPSQPGGVENQPNQVEGQTWPLSTVSGKTFSGMIDGHGHTVKGINVSHGSATQKGLFGSYLEPVANFTAGVKNLTITDSFVRGKGESGGLFGRVKTGADNTAKVAFENLLLDIDVYANGRYAGMIAGTCYARSAEVNNVVVRGDMLVSGGGNGENVYAGGFFGHILPSDTTYKSTVAIRHSVYEGTLTTTYNYQNWDWLGMGGFIGVVGGGANLGGAITLENCAFYGSLVAKGNVSQQTGGFIGKTYGGCTSVINVTNVISCGYMSTVSGNNTSNTGIVLGILASNATFNLTNAVGTIRSIAGYQNITTNGIGTVPCSTSKTDRWWSITNAATGPNMFDNPAQSSLVFTFSSGAVACDLSNTFVATTATKPLPMGVVNFYADQMGIDKTGAVTDAYGYQTKNEGDTTSIRLIGLLKADENLPAFESVGLEVVAIRKNGATVKSVNNANVAATDNVYTSLLANGQTVKASDMNENYKYLFTVAVEGIQVDGGEITLVVRSFHVVDGVRTYDDTRVINYDPANA